MRTFFRHFYKGMVAIYLCIVVVFAYATLLSAIPDCIYVTEGEESSLSLSIPVTFEKKEDEAATVSGTAGIGTLALSDIAGESAHLATSGYTIVGKFCGIIPVKEVEVRVVSAKSVFASGRVIGIYGQTSGVLALRTETITASDGTLVSPAENRVLPGDYIVAVNGEAVATKEQLVTFVQQYGKNRIVLSVKRKEETIDVAIDPVCTADQTYLLGIWVKDDMAGIGTMTYYTTDGHFGALGHGIGDGETGDLLSMSEGSIYNMRLLGIQKGQTGTPGELEGVISYGSENYLGTVEANGDMGISGTLETEVFMEFSGEDTCFEIGFKQDILSGAAYILSDISGQVESYEIAIDSVDYRASDTNKGIHFHVEDENLLALTGGIVQGMSGSPIIQNGKIIGAVTHVLVNDPTKGYGIFIETMLEE